MNWKRIFLQPKTWWVLLGLLAIVLRGLLSPDLIEQAYSRGLYMGTRQVISMFTGWLPFAFVYPLFFIVVFWLGKNIAQFFKDKTPWPRRLFGALTWWLAFAGGTVFFFLFLWGFNYGRVPLEQQVGIEPKPLEISELRDELDATTAEVCRLRLLLSPDSDSALTNQLLPADLENTMRQALTKKLVAMGYPTTGQVRGRLLFPKGLLLRISTAGVYIPFTGEGHIDPGLHHLQLPWVMAHELSHGYGHGDEGTCNFLAYLVCTGSNDPYLQYVGHLYYWRYVASDYRGYLPDEYKVFYENLPNGVKNDLLDIRREMDKYPDILPAVRDATYNAYLKAQGISEGMKNYDRVTMLVHAWRRASG